MVMINDQCINHTVPPGTFGGAMCTCKKCSDSRAEAEASNLNAGLYGSNDPEKLRTALRFLLDASKPYLRRKKMTPRNDCAILNAVHGECEKLLTT